VGGSEDDEVSAENAGKVCWPRQDEAISERMTMYRLSDAARRLGIAPLEDWHDCPSDDSVEVGIKSEGINR
jgi:hypothetical protein